MDLKTIVTFAALTLSGLHPAVAGSHASKGLLTAKITFSAIDSTSKGHIDQGDLHDYSFQVFVSMDSDDNDRLTYQEFEAWDPGFSLIAEEKGKADAFVTAKKIVFAFWDRNDDGELTRSEMRHAMNADFRRADVNDDAILNEREFLRGFSIMVAMRAAIRPDL